MHLHYISMGIMFTFLYGKALERHFINGKSFFRFLIPFTKTKLTFSLSLMKALSKYDY